ncbi:hypothetical protein [Wenyingzhuangia sp. IMCC45467]
MILRASNFFGFCYADEIAECEFFAKNFSFILQQNNLVFSFLWVRGLDLKKIKPNITAYQFFEIEDVYLRNKLIEVIKKHNHIKKMSLQVDTELFYIKKLKFTHKGFRIEV